MPARVVNAGLLTLLMFAACGPGPSNTAAPAPPPPATTAAPAAAPISLEGTVAPQEEPTGDIEFKSALDLNQNPKPGAIQLRGGQEAVSKDWPASLYVTFKTSRGLASCTAALIGPKVMLTAAHCVPSSGKVSFVYAGHKQAYSTTCTRHNRYPADASADYALCLVTPDFAAPGGFVYEKVNSSAIAGLVNRPIILTGFGCVSDIVDAAQTDNKYRIGGNTIQQTSDSSPQSRGAAFYKPRELNNLFTTDSPGTANLCPGDSGGPAFLRSSGGANVFTNRTIIGVNSRVFYADAKGTTYGSSLISSTGGPDFFSWAENWAKAKNVDACGINGLLPNCRS